MSSSLRRLSFLYSGVIFVLKELYVIALIILLCNTFNWFKVVMRDNPQLMLMGPWWAYQCLRQRLIQQPRKKKLNITYSNSLNHFKLLPYSNAVLCAEQISNPIWLLCTCVQFHQLSNGWVLGRIACLVERI